MIVSKDWSFITTLLLKRYNPVASECFKLAADTPRISINEPGQLSD